MVWLYKNKSTPFIYKTNKIPGKWYVVKCPSYTSYNNNVTQKPKAAIIKLKMNAL